MRTYLYIITLMFWTACESSERQSVIPPQLKGKIVYSKPLVSFPITILIVQDLDSASEQIVSDSIYGYFDEPNWSPDGKRVAFTEPSFEGPYMYFIYMVYKARRLLGGYAPHYPLWSPDGDKILSSIFSLYTFQIIDTLSNSIYHDGPDSLVWDSTVLFLKKGHVRWNTEEDVFLAASPLRGTEDNTMQHDSLREIYRFNYVTETLVERMTHNLLDESNFEISHDRQRIVFSQGRKAEKITYLMNISGATARPIIQGEHETVKWFGKTHYLYYVRFPNPTVYVIDTDHPNKEYELMPVYNKHIDIWAQPETAGE